jgi:hypothetical protein
MKTNWSFIFVLSIFHLCANILQIELSVFTAMASTENSWHDSYPTAYSNHNRVLGMILAFNYDHIDPLNLIMGQYQSMCEGGWYPTVAVFTTANWSDTMKRYFRQRTFCYRINASIPIIVDVHPPSIGFGLGQLNSITFIVYYCFTKIVFDTQAPNIDASWEANWTATMFSFTTRTISS